MLRFLNSNKESVRNKQNISAGWELLLAKLAEEDRQCLVNELLVA